MDDVNRERGTIGNATTFLQLPSEIRNRILSHLDARSLIRLSCVSHGLRRLAFEPSLWRHVTWIHYDTPNNLQPSPSWVVAPLRMFSRLVERTPLRHECLQSFSIVYIDEDQVHTGRYEVARDLIEMTNDKVVNLLVLQFRYVYHCTTETAPASDLIPFFIPVHIGRHIIPFIPFPNLDERVDSFARTGYLYFAGEGPNNFEYFYLFINCCQAAFMMPMLPVFFCMMNN